MRNAINLWNVIQATHKTSDWDDHEAAAFKANYKPNKP